MSSTVRRSGGRHDIQFSYGGRRRTVYLGKCSRATADRFRELVDRLCEYVRLGLAPDAEMAAWLERMGDGPRKTLVTCGLADQRGIRTLGGLCRRYINSLHERQAAGQAKPATLFNARVVVDNLLEHFNENTPLTTIDLEDCEEFRSWLTKHGRRDSPKPLAATTVSRRCRRCREIFETAVDAGWLTRNPWKGMRGFRESNPERDVYVERADIERVIAACPDREVRLLLSLARYVGVRVPSELQRLELADLNIETGVVRIRSSKTEHHEGKAERLAPLWPEVEPHVRAVFDGAPIGQVLAMPNLANVTGAAITSRVRRACVAAGVNPWLKLWINVRASCESDLYAEYPIDVVTDWLGHSPKVALQHYSRAKRRSSAAAAAAKARANHQEAGVGERSADQSALSRFAPPARSNAP